jgi:putative DNA primase/helicase
MEVSPMHVITKPKAGSGGSYLQDLAAAIATGEHSPVLSLTKRNDEENEKRLVAAVISGRLFITIDNVTTLLWGDFLCQLTERPRLSPRKLGFSEVPVLDNTFFVNANGNNLMVGGDNVRRTVQISLDTNMENPEEREFKGDPFNTVLRDRGRYVRAALIIVLAYLAAGSPNKLKPKVSYQHWSDRVRSALCWLGCADTERSVEQLRSQDPVHGRRTAVFTGWAAAPNLKLDTGYRTGELIKAAEQNRDSKPELWEALLDVAMAREAGKLIDPDRLGKWLRDNKNNVAAGHKLRLDDSDKQRPKWVLAARKGQ